MFNSLSTGSFLGTGTAFREASFSWRRGHFLLSHYPFFVLFHSRLRVLHIHWQCGLLARPLNSTVFSISLLIVNYFLLITLLFLCVSSCSMPCTSVSNSFWPFTASAPCAAYSREECDARRADRAAEHSWHCRTLRQQGCRQRWRS